jgi:sialidase-1
MAPLPSNGAARVPLLFAALAALASADSPAPLTPVELFPRGSSPGVNNFRIPALVRCAGDGVLLAFAEARSAPSDCAPKWVVYRRSADNGTTWSPAAVLYRPSGAGETAGNPAVVYDAARGRVVVIVAQGDAAHCNPTLYTLVFTSADSGLSFSAPRNISAQIAPWAGTLPGPGTAAQIPPGAARFGGRIVVPAHNGAYAQDVVYFSDDGGETWTVGATQLPKMDEAVIAVQRNGSLLLNMRNAHDNACDCRAVSRSDDGGASFSLPVVYDAALISPVCQASLVEIAGALYFSNPASTRARVNTTIRRSDDDGATWRAQTFVAEPGASAGYSCMAAGDATFVDAEGRQFGSILYEDAAAGISFRLFPLDLAP